MVYDPFSAASDMGRPKCECDPPLEEETVMWEGGQFSMIEDIILSPQGLPLISLKTWLAATRQRQFTLSVLHRLAITHPKAPLPPPGVQTCLSKAPLCLPKWANVLSNY